MTKYIFFVLFLYIYVCSLNVICIIAKKIIIKIWKNCFCLTLQAMSGGGVHCTPPPSLVFLPFTQNIFRQPIPENSWPYKTFYCRCPYEKKNQKIYFYPLSEHFEIWVRKPPMAERVNSYTFLILNTDFSSIFQI